MATADSSDERVITGEQRGEPQFHRGFFDAEKRRRVINYEDTLGTAIGRGLLVALPTIFLFWVFTRGRLGAMKAQQAMSEGKGKGIMGDAMKNFQKMMDPLGDKQFKVTDLKGTGFKDVVGVPEALAEVKQYVDFLKFPSKFTRLGGRLPKGCLLTGQPGTGKTMLAKAVAGEAGVPFFTCSGADFIEVFAGSGPKRVRDLFSQARADAPCVIFIDEIDAVGQRANKESAGNVSSEENRTVNQILAELDGLQAAEAVVVFAATNYPENLDKALMREGRFDRKVELPMPDRDARRDVFQHYLNRVVTGDPKGLLEVTVTETVDAPPSGTAGGETPAGGAAASSSTAGTTTPGKTTKVSTYKLEPNPSVSNAAMALSLAELTPGISPATISAIVNEGALAAAIGGSEAVKLTHLMPAIDDVLVGKKHRSRMSEAGARRVAMHEAGHTIVAWVLGQQSKVIKVSITPRGRAAGFTQQVGKEALEHTTDASLFTDICVLLAGRAAELTTYTNLTTGASDDFQRATKNAVNQFLAFGMSERVGMLSFDYQRIDEGRMYQLFSEETQRTAEVEAGRLIAIAYEATTKLIADHKEQLLRLTDALVEKREIVAADIEAIMGPRPPSDALHPVIRDHMAQYHEAARKAAVDPAAIAKAAEAALDSDVKK